MITRRSLRIIIFALAALTPAGRREAMAFDPSAGDFARAEAGHVRVMTYNTERNFIADSSTDAAYQRILRAIDPDVIVFQEIPTSISVSTFRARLNTIFAGESWNVHFGVGAFGEFAIRNVLCSRLPLSMQVQDTVPPSDTGARGVTAALVDLPASPWGNTNLYVMGLHWKSGGTVDDHQRRQVQADALVSWMRDARTPGGWISLPTRTPMVVAGDLNIGYQGGGDTLPYHASRTILDGSIYNTGTYGTSSPPDWDGTSLTDAAPHEHTTGDPDTHNSTANSPISRLDRIIYTDSAIRVANRFILSTRRMTSGALASAGLQSNDTANAADHLPVVVDFAPGEEGPPGRLLFNEFSYDDVGTDDRTFIELVNAGTQPINLDAPRDYWFVRTSNNAATTPPGSSNQNARVDLKGVIPPGGLFVLYSSGADSQAVASKIIARLPALQRQSVTGFTLPNGPAVAMALIEQRPAGTTAQQDIAVEAYAYEASTVPGAVHYLRTTNDTPVTIPVLGPQLSAFSTVTDDSFSRRRGDRTPNTFAEWVIPDTPTPGLPNNTGLDHSATSEAWLLLP